MKSIAALFILFFITTHCIFAENFSPWNADVSVGDAALSDLERLPKHISFRPLYNSFSTSAWFFLRFFQIFISPQDGPNCRFNPTCSRYASEAVQKYGAILGSFLAGDRLIRCNPYNPPGNDPVPEILP